MSVRDTVTAIMQLETIDELASFVGSRPMSSVRRELLDAFDALVEYVDANQWATAVRICETLAIVGWGSREQVDAISRFNGDAWETQFITDKDEYRFRFAYWSKRKAGWTLRNARFHASPDFPDRPPIDWPYPLPLNRNRNAQETFPIVDRDTLPSQRNYRLQMPITIGIYCGENETSAAATLLCRELRRELLERMTPAAYGGALERFYFTFHCPALSANCEARLKIGNYNTKQRAFYSELYFSDEFGRMSRADQRAYISRNLLTAIDALSAKLRKRGIDYDIAAFRAHVQDAIDRWDQQDG